MSKDYDVHRKTIESSLDRRGILELYDRNIFKQYIVPYLQCIKREGRTSTYKVMEGVSCRSDLAQVLNYIWTPSTTLKIFHVDRIDIFRITTPVKSPRTSMMVFSSVYGDGDTEMRIPNPNISNRERRLLRSKVLDNLNDEFSAIMSFVKVDEEKLPPIIMPKNYDRYGILVVPQLKRTFVVQYKRLFDVKRSTPGHPVRAHSRIVARFVAVMTDHL